MGRGMQFEIVEELKKLPPESPLPVCKHIPCRVVGAIPWRWKRYEKTWTDYGFEPDDFASTIILWWIEKTDPSYDPTRGASAATLAITSITWAIDYALRAVAGSRYGSQDLLRRKMLVSRPLSIYAENEDGSETMLDVGCDDLEHEVETADENVRRFDEVCRLAGVGGTEFAVFRARFVDGLTHKEIGEKLGFSRARAHQLELRGRYRIHEFMGECETFADVLVRERRKGRWHARTCLVRNKLRGPATDAELLVVAEAEAAKKPARVVTPAAQRARERVAAGVCVRCGKVRGESPSKSKCEACFLLSKIYQANYWKERNRGQYTRDRRERRKAEGGCVYCSAPRHPDSDSCCAKCLVRDRVRERARSLESGETRGRSRAEYPNGRKPLQGTA